jgi:hypothetical protein
VLGGVHGGHERDAQAVGQALGRDRDEPVVSVHHVEAQCLAKRRAAGQKVVVHVSHPRHEALQVILGPLGFGHAVDDHAVAVLLGLGGAPAAGEHVHLAALGDELLGELAHVTCEAALDDGRVLPRDDEDPSGHGADNPSGGVRKYPQATARTSEHHH